MADPRLAARRRVDKFASADTSDLVYGRNSVLEALRVGVPSSTLYIMSRIEHDDRTREIVKIAGMNGLHMLEADRLEMDRIARSGNHQGVILKVDPFQYSSLRELADRAEKKAKAMEAANSAAARIAARPLFIALDGGGDKLVGETGFETDPLVVVLGSEGSGLSRLVRESCDAIAGIPISSSVESLNASVAAGISLYAVSRARREGAESAQ